MRIAILGAGALGCFIGGSLARAGQDVTLVETDEAIVRAVAEQGVKVAGLVGRARTVRVPITNAPAAIGQVDLVVVCVRYWQTEAAIGAALPIIGPDTAVLTFQAGWGDADDIAARVGPERTVIGLSAEVAVSVGPGRAKLLFSGENLIGGYTADFPTDRLEAIAACFEKAQLLTSAEPAIREAIWGTLATDTCALPLCALLRYEAHQLVEHAGTLDLLRGMHREVVTVAAGLGLPFDEEASWETLYNYLEGATGSGAGIFQEMRRDLDRLQRSDVDRFNGAIVDAGRRLGIPTPYNEAVLWLIRAQERRDDGVR